MLASTLVEQFDACFAIDGGFAHLILDASQIEFDPSGSRFRGRHS